jgi:hypothetical protein
MIHASEIKVYYLEVFVVVFFWFIPTSRYTYTWLLTQQTLCRLVNDTWLLNQQTLCRLVNETTMLTMASVTSYETPSKTNPQKKLCLCR